MMYEDYLEIAAEMLEDGDEVWAGNLHSDLVQMLRAQAALTEKLKGNLVSRQAIAGTIIAWQRMNPNALPYSKET